MWMRRCVYNVLYEWTVSQGYPDKVAAVKSLYQQYLIEQHWNAAANLLRQKLIGVTVQWVCELGQPSEVDVEKTAHFQRSCDDRLLKLNEMIDDVANLEHDGNALMFLFRDVDRVQGIPIDNVWVGECPDGVHDWDDSWGDETKQFTGCRTCGYTVQNANWLA